jgi:protein TonB
MMARIALDAGVDAGTLRRLALALAVSAVVHAGVIVAIRAGPPSVSTAPGMPIEARIEPAERRGESELSLAVPSPVPMQEVADAPAANSAAAPPATPARELSLPPSAPAPAGSAQASNGATPAQTPLAPDSAYYLITALDRPPVPLTAPEACYPQGATGEVTYELLIDEKGVVNQATVLAVRPVGLFTAAAAELCRALKFSPAVKDGRAVRSRVRFVVGPR